MRASALLFLPALLQAQSGDWDPGVIPVTWTARRIAQRRPTPTTHRFEPKQFRP
jgi:hypothetical protein